MFGIGIRPICIICDTVVGIQVLTTKWSVWYRNGTNLYYL